jgi:Tfp pilus assembly protein PilP
MKLLNSAFVLFGLAAVAAAQSAAPPSQVVAAKPAAASSQKAKAKSPFAPSKTAAGKPASAPAKGTAVSSQKSGAEQSAAAAKPEVMAAKAATARGRRDPFINPVVKASATGGQPVPCSNGKRCLAIHEMVLRGVVKGQNGMIAVVENAARKTYFLRENDPVFNGYVVRITGDSVIFKENTQDSAGHATSHEVVKTLAPQV